MNASRSLPPVHPPETADVDIVVVGGGMAGVMAALAAKTSGNRVVLIEPSNVLGGQGTAGGVAGFCGDTERVNRPFAELVGKLARHHLIAPYRPDDDRRAYDLEWCAFFLQEMTVAAGIEVWLHSRVIAVEAAGGEIRALSVATASDVRRLRPRFVIDASGGCTVAVLAGFSVFHEGANRQLPMSLYFTLWDTGKPVTPILPDGCARWTHDDEIPMTSLHRFPSGKVEVKMKVVGFDAADGLSRSQAEIFARRQMHALIYYLQTVGYRGAKLDTHVLAGVSRGIGIREERRIVGEHVLTEHEARRTALFADAVAVNTYHIDFHWPDRMQRAGTGITDMLAPHHLPLRMMIPRGAGNLLVPGRGASGDQTAMSAFRVMAVVAQMGFAAGHAARLCVEDGRRISQLDLRRLQVALEAEGQSLNLSHYGDYLRTSLFVHEEVRAAGSGPWHSLALRQEGNAIFVFEGVDAPGRRWRAERRESQWTVTPAETGATPANLAAEIPLSGSVWAKVAIRDGYLVAQVSRDGLVSWSAPQELAPAGGTSVAAVATATGLAIGYMAPDGSLRFWHGSVERLRGEAVVPAAVRLNAPPADSLH